MAFGERLQEVRRRAGLTQEQFAAELNVSRQAVSKWESCRGYPEIEKILYICNRYQVSLDELFSQEVPRQAPAQPAPDTPPLPEKTLKTALSAFFANLSPREKWLGLGAVAGTLALALALGLCLKGGTTDMMTIIWIAAMVIFGVVEAVTVGLASIWFVVGSVAGLIAAICGGPVWLQIALFFVVSIVCLAATRPLVKKLLHKDGCSEYNKDLTGLIHDVPTACADLEQVESYIAARFSRNSMRICPRRRKMLRSIAKRTPSGSATASRT